MLEYWVTVEMRILVLKENVNQFWKRNIRFAMTDKLKVNSDFSKLGMLI